MPCCGNQRTRVLPEPAAPTVRHSQVSFQYMGSTALTAMGAVTGTRYRFDSDR